MATIVLPIPDDLLRNAKELAAAENASLSQLLLSLIAERIGELRAVRSLQERAVRGRLENGLAVLDGAPDTPAAAGDALPSRKAGGRRRG